MRAQSSEKVVQRAEEVARKILDTYLEPDKNFVELREMAIGGSINLYMASARRAAANSRSMRVKQF